MTARDVARDLAFEGWIARGRAVRVVEELGRRGHLSRLKRVGTELAGPCPLCGGTDRFGVNPSRNVWNCRGCGIGGDAIKLVRNVDGVDFLQAIEILTGEPRPGALTGESAAEREIRHAAQTARIAEAEAADARKANEQAGFRERERLRMWDVWKAGRPIGGTVAESYLARRRVGPRPRAPPDCCRTTRCGTGRRRTAPCCIAGRPWRRRSSGRRASSPGCT